MKDFLIDRGRLALKHMSECLLELCTLMQMNPYPEILILCMMVFMRVMYFSFNYIINLGVFILLNIINNLIL
jgi:hypothetical protein